MKSAAFLILSIVGLFFSLSGAVGILRMPDLYSRIQCSSKTITMGALPVLVALVVGEGIDSNYASRALLVGALLLLVNPAASHALARAAYKRGVPMWSGAVRDEVAEEQQSLREKRADEPEHARPAEQEGRRGRDLPEGPAPGGDHGGRE